MKKNVAETTINFEQKRKELCSLISIRLRNSKLTQEERLNFLNELQELSEKLPKI